MVRFLAVALESVGVGALAALVAPSFSQTGPSAPARGVRVLQNETVYGISTVLCPW